MNPADFASIKSVLNATKTESFCFLTAKHVVKNQKKKGKKRDEKGLQKQELRGESGEETIIFSFTKYKNEETTQKVTKWEI